MDSDEEYERRPRGRDKFRRERSDYNERSARRDDRSSRRDDNNWSDRRRPGVWDSRRKDYRGEFERDRRDSGGRHHENISPPMKRTRRDWDNVGFQAEYPGFNPMANQWVPPMEMPQNVHQRPQYEGPQHPVDIKVSHGPVMMSFKQFLNSMEDNIDDMEAVKKYQTYKVEFRKTQIADFFTTHKDDEWFRNKYHPIDSLSHQTKQNSAVRKRAAVFLDLFQSGWLEKFSLTIAQGEEDIDKLLDAAVIKFEGGTDFDLQVLDKPVEEEKKTSLSNDQDKQTTEYGKNKGQLPDFAPISPSSVPLPNTPAPASATVRSAGFKAIKPLEMMSDPSPEQLKLREEAEKYHQLQLLQQLEQVQNEGQVTQQEDAPSNDKGQVCQKGKRKRRHREPYYYDENVESESESESDIESEPAPPGEETARRDAKERAAEEHLLPPGVELVSNDEVTSEPPMSNDEVTSEPLAHGVEPVSNDEVTSEPLAPGVEPVSNDEVTSEPLAPVEPVSNHKVTSEPLAPGVEPVSNGEVTSELLAAVGPVSNHEVTSEPPAPGVEPVSNDEMASPGVEPVSNDEMTSEPPVSNDQMTSEALAPRVKPVSNNELTSEPPAPGVEPVSNDEVMLDQGDIRPPGTEDDGQDIAKSAHVETELPVNDNETVDKVKQDDAEETVKSSIVTMETTTKTTEETKEDANEGSAEVKQEVKQTVSEEDVKMHEIEEKTEGEQNEQESESNENKMDTHDAADDKTKEEEAPPEVINDVPKVEEIKTPRPLHQTVSLFVRNVPPKISRNDIASVCSRFPGFMRVVLSDPSPERKFSRRGWITFKPDVNIKDICWTINNMKIKEIELNPIVNRELARRVRTVSGASVLKEMVETDISMARKLIEQLDEKYRVWVAEETSVKSVAEKKVKESSESKVEEISDETIEDPSVPQSPPDEPKITPVEEQPKIEPEKKLPKSNPVLALLPAIVSDSAPAQETAQETAAMKTGGEEGQLAEEGQVAEEGDIPPEEKTPSDCVAPVVDEVLVKLLDRLLLYLRIVHSLDYYSGAEYLYEDDMPNRCGIVHTRNTLPEKINYDEVNEWHKNLHLKLGQHLKKKEQITEEDALQLGKKDQDQEMEKFVQVNTQELAKDKWLCPLSGKKFRGPEFVKKHIFNKHGDKVEGVKTEVAFFNNFVYDTNRPSEPDMRPAMPGLLPNPGFQGVVVHPMGIPNMGWGRGGGMMQQGRGGFASNISPNFRPGPEHYNNRGQGFQNKSRRGSMRRDPRQIIKYTDLDAPGEEMEFF